ncbi:DUF6049 family protein [Microbacterium sp. Root53]|uniref:DUF6049 family protein n=1 Tax=Microbacterium sp. Root53 TaxID=1736553 RepID=UPI000B1F3323|nr:DUF6049 family protein [Microbacterium sp. Root53]
MTTDLPRRQAAPRRRPLAPLPAAAFAVLLGLACAAPAHAAVEPDEPTADLTLAPAAQGFLRPGASLTTTLTIENASTEPIEGATATLSIGRTPLADRTQLRAWLDGTTQGVTLTPAGTAPAEDLAPGAQDTVGIAVPADHEALEGLRPGVYPIRAQLGDATAESVVVIEDETEPVGLVVPITAAPQSSGLLGAEQLAELTAPEGALTAQLDAVAGTEAILAIDPAIPAAIRALRDTAPESAVEWLDRLMVMPNDRFALQFADADVAAQLQAGLETPLSPISLEAYLAAPPQPDPTPTPTETVAGASEPEEELDLDALLDIGDAEPSIHWPMPGAVGPGVLDALRTPDPDAIALVPSDATTQGADGSAVPARGDGLLIYDAGVTAALDDVARATGEPARDAAAVAASAELWFAAEQTGDAPLLVALDRGAGLTDEDGADDAAADLVDRLSAAVDVVTGSAAIDAQRLPQLLDAAPAAVTPAEPSADESRAAFVTETIESEKRIARTATVLEDPTLLTGQVRAEALHVLSVGWDGERSAWEDAVTAFRERTGERANAVGIEPPATVQLISAGANLPVWIRNDLPYEVTVTLVARPDDPRLDVVEFTQVVAQPSSSTTIEVPVEARVGNGDVDIELSLLSPEGELIGPVQTVEVTVRADWERIGIIVLVALVVGLIGTGIVRTVLRRRRAAAAEPTGSSGTDDEPSKGPDA